MCLDPLSSFQTDYLAEYNRSWFLLAKAIMGEGTSESGDVPLEKQQYYEDAL